MIRIEGLTKRYGTYHAVEDVGFECLPGRVTGFLGPNGAGKTTVMRVLTGLTTATSGTATIDGQTFREIANPGRHIGVLLDASAQHAGRTGREVLRLGAESMGLPLSRAHELLNVVSLTDEEADRRIRNYSLGMRQRLGIAHALLGDPHILVLDEPANGLDPAGIHWMRSVLRQFADRGGTVLLSSHLLTEIQLVADDLVVIGRGRVVVKGPQSELLKGTGTLARTSDLEGLAAALRRAGIGFQRTGPGAVRADGEPEAVGLAAAIAGVPLAELRVADGGGLEDLFLELTANTQRESATPIPGATP